MRSFRWSADWRRSGGGCQAEEPQRVHDPDVGLIRLRQSDPEAPGAGGRKRQAHNEDLEWTFTSANLRPPVPDRVGRLPELANDLWWTWNTKAREVFRKLDYPLWRQTAHNPVLMLRLISPELLEQRAQDEPFLRLYDAAIESLDTARATHDTWWHRRYPDANGSIAYFSAEFALHQSLPIYAEDSACWPAITARKRATSGFRSSASASCTRRDTSIRP